MVYSAPALPAIIKLLSPQLFDVPLRPASAILNQTAELPGIQLLHPTLYVSDWKAVPGQKMALHTSIRATRHVSDYGTNVTVRPKRPFKSY
jgi:hypothetical protein